MPSLPRPRAELRLALAGIALCLVVLPGEAAPLRRVHGAKAAATTNVGPKLPATAKSKRPEPGDVTGTTEPNAAWTSGEQDERACYRGRRKLWDGEGWVVKKVNVCP